MNPLCLLVCFEALFAQEDKDDPVIPESSTKDLQMKAVISTALLHAVTAGFTQGGSRNSRCFVGKVLVSKTS